MKANPISFFSKQFPMPRTPRAKILLSLYIGILVFIFIVLFRPAQTEPLPFFENLIAAGVYAVSAVVVLFLSQLLLQKYVAGNVCSRLRLLLWSGLNFFLVGNSNSFVSFFIFRNTFTVRNYLSLQIGTFSTGIVTVLIISLLYQNIRLKKIVTDDDLLVSDLDRKSRVTINPGHASNSLCLNSDQILMIKAMENYVVVFFINREDTLAQKTIRATMKQVEQDLNDNKVFLRCHRSYLINRTRATRLLKGKSGYRLELERIDETIPFARGMNKRLIKLFPHL